VLLEAVLNTALVAVPHDLLDPLLGTLVPSTRGDSGWPGRDQRPDQW
jgi:hypothetical protein